MEELIKKIESEEVGKYWNSVNVVAKYITTIKDPMLAVQLINLLGIVDAKSQEAYEKRQEEKDGDDI